MLNKSREKSLLLVLVFLIILFTYLLIDLNYFFKNQGKFFITIDALIKNNFLVHKKIDNFQENLSNNSEGSDISKLIEDEFLEEAELINYEQEPLNEIFFENEILKDIEIKESLIYFSTSWCLPCQLELDSVLIPTLSNSDLNLIIIYYDSLAKDDNRNSLVEYFGITRPGTKIFIKSKKWLNLGSAYWDELRLANFLKINR